MYDQESASYTQKGKHVTKRPDQKGYKSTGM